MHVLYSNVKEIVQGKANKNVSTYISSWKKLLSESLSGSFGCSSCSSSLSASLASCSRISISADVTLSVDLVNRRRDPSSRTDSASAASGDGSSCRTCTLMDSLRESVGSGDGDGDGDATGGAIVALSITGDANMCGKTPRSEMGVCDVRGEVNRFAGRSLKGSIASSIEERWSSLSKMTCGCEAGDDDDIDDCDDSCAESAPRLGEREKTEGEKLELESSDDCCDDDSEMLSDAANVGDEAEESCAR